MHVIIHTKLSFLFLLFLSFAFHLYTHFEITWSVWTRLVCIAIDVRSSKRSAAWRVDGVQPPVVLLRGWKSAPRLHGVTPSSSIGTATAPDWSRGEIKFGISWDSPEAGNPVRVPKGRPCGGGWERGRCRCLYRFHLKGRERTSKESDVQSRDRVNYVSPPPLPIKGWIYLKVLYQRSSVLMKDAIT